MNNVQTFDVTKYTRYKYPYAGVFSECIAEPFMKNVLQISLANINSMHWIINDLQKYQNTIWTGLQNKLGHIDFQLKVDNPNNIRESYILDVDLKMNRNGFIHISKETIESNTDKLNMYYNRYYPGVPYIATFIENSPGKWWLYLCDFEALQNYINGELIKLEDFKKAVISSERDKPENKFTDIHYCNWKNDARYSTDNNIIGISMNALCSVFENCIRRYNKEELYKLSVYNDHFINYAYECADICSKYFYR